MIRKLKVCFFSTVKQEKLLAENYSIQDIKILQELGHEVILADSFSKIPFGCDLYFSWWASGSILPLIKAIISNKPIIVVAGGNEVMLYRDSLDGVSGGYLCTPLYKKIATKIVLRWAAKVLIVSKFMKNDALRLGAKDPVVVHNCVDTEIFKPAKNNERKYVLSIFRLEEGTIKLKRGEIFIKAIAEVIKIFPDQEFIVIGKKGDAFTRLSKLIHELGIEKNVKLMGEIPNSEVLKWLQQTKLYVQISDTETFGLAIAEAMSCEVPVLVSNRGAIPEVVGELGRYVDHNDVQSVASGMIHYLSLPDAEQRALGSSLRRRIEEKFPYEKRKESIKKMINSIFLEQNTNEY